ncbi:group XV phospholipase A2 [Thecamonas trahens ATCC 50062]|uniref:Group XV phospholipase A2 n=1 Tax=Thecamonas trahens ATCC 50062 TaxID=461836 RepID=A0A0L0DRR0_THETB|nr:group XV phospholipase A2 [Thecamonas trahens ATCC 50062]KNC54108.1 group XV phospholipase A2 [Thecamonas trahens ATCC 50062]|eukprot:XP_013753931.1 group XV phospholipase A2 [Thecamonas trahens ATCC 50062]
MKVGERFASEAHAPVLVIPGLGGSQLNATLAKPHTVHVYCTKNQGSHLQWLKISSLVASRDCFFDNIRLVYDDVDNVYYDSPGVTITPVGYGTMDGVNSLDNEFGFRSITTYMAKLTAAFTAAGYPEWFSATMDMIEEMYTEANGTQVHILGHSMGGAMGSYLLANADPAWKAKYVASFIPMGAPLGGAPGVLKALISGASVGMTFFNISLVKPHDFAVAIRNWHAAVADCIVTDASTGVCYGLNNISRLFVDANATSTAQIYSQTLLLDLGTAPPGVPVHCLIGNSVETEVAFSYPSGLGQQPAATTTMDGDGTVPGTSLRVCGQWGARQSAPVELRTFDKAEHGAMPGNPEILDYLLQIVTTS